MYLVLIIQVYSLKYYRNRDLIDKFISAINMLVLCDVCIRLPFPHFLKLNDLNATGTQNTVLILLFCIILENPISFKMIIISRRGGEYYNSNANPLVEA